MYLDRSAHIQTTIATEDTLYLLPEARKGRAAIKFVAYVEDALKQIGAKEINITVEDCEHGGQVLSGLGYKHVDDGLTKILGTSK